MVWTTAVEMSLLFFSIIPIRMAQLLHYQGCKNGTFLLYLQIIKQTQKWQIFLPNYLVLKLIEILKS